MAKYFSSLSFFFINPNQTWRWGGGGEKIPSPLPYLVNFALYRFSKSTKFYEILWLFLKFVGDLYSEFIFYKFKLVFAMSALFHDQMLSLLYVFCWKNEHLLDNISRISVQKV